MINFWSNTYHVGLKSEMFKKSFKKLVITRICKSKKDRQDNGLKKKKKKGQTLNYKKLCYKLMIEQHELHQKPGMNSQGL
jgi:hypothetical protein